MIPRPRTLGSVLLWCACFLGQGAEPPFSTDGNRLTYLDTDDPFYPGPKFPKLITPQWVGEPGVEAVIILAIDDLRDSKKYEAFLRPILERLKQIDGRAPVSIFANVVTHSDPRAREGILREAVLAFQKYPDLEINFSRQLAEVLRVRGETSLAGFEEQRLGKKYQADRGDLSIQQAAQMLERSMKQDDPATQIRTYNKVLDASGQGAGIDFYDKVVLPFVRHLAASGQVPAALTCLDRARRTLRIEPGRQLDQEMAGMAAQLKAGKF